MKKQETKEVKEKQEKQEKQISPFQKELNEVLNSVPPDERILLKNAHFDIISETQGHTNYFNLGLLHQILYFRKKYILYADIVEVIKRNHDGLRALDNTELRRLFVPEEMFIEQCVAIRERREKFLSKNKQLIYGGILKEIEEKDLF